MKHFLKKFYNGGCNVKKIGFKISESSRAHKKKVATFDTLDNSCEAGGHR
jgi:hypothetical protein